MVKVDLRSFFNVNGENYTRVILLTISGILFSAAPAVWISLGYLDPLAWFLEWSDIILAISLMVASLKIQERIEPIKLLIIAVISFAIALISFYESTYYPTFILLVIPVIVSGLFLSILKGNAKFSSLSFFVIVVATLSIMSYLYLSVSPAIPTDETLLTLYAAHVFIRGLNPYSPGVMNNAFAFYNFPVYLGTPFTTGGYVHSITYPALSFIIQIPSVVFNFPTSYIMLPFLVLPAFLIWLKAWSAKKWSESIFVLFPLLGLLIYSSQASNADLNPVWLSLLMISYFVLPKTKLSGVFLGLSVAVKQLPIFSIPFYFYFIYREYGFRRAILWILIAFTTFLAINGYFMFENFSGFLSSIIQDEISPMIGVGSGPSQLSFLGILPLGRSFFTTITFFLFAVAILIYVWKYKNAKYALFAFPAIILFFNYRYFGQYSFYWLAASLLPLVEIIDFKAKNEIRGLREKPAWNLSINSKKIKKLAIITVVLLVSCTLVFHYVPQNQPSYFQINSVSLQNVNSSGYVNAMKVNIVYEGKINTSTYVLFRVITPGKIENANMFLWEPTNNTLIQSHYDYVLTIHPIYPEFTFQNNGTFRVIAYYGAIQGAYEFS